jgi:hypothetical protein
MSGGNSEASPPLSAIAIAVVSPCSRAALASKGATKEEAGSEKKPRRRNGRKLSEEERGRAEAVSVCTVHW